MSVPEDDTRMSPGDMRAWLQGEIAEVMKAAELRVKEATAFVMAYNAGKISQDEAEKRSDAYLSRWGEAIPGVILNPGMTDEAIYQKMDEMEAKFGDGKWQGITDRGQGKRGKGRSGA